MGKHVGSGKIEPRVSGGGRHKAEDVADPANTGQIVRTPGGYKSKIAQVVVATGTMALVTASASPAAPPSRHAAQVEPDVKAEPEVVKAPKHAALAFEKVDVRTEPAPPPPIVQEPREVEQKIVREKAPVAKLPVVPPAKPAVKAPPAPAKPPAVKVAPAPAPAAGTYGPRGAIGIAALNQLGVTQDCTRLVTNALKAVGINHHGWPVSYLALGHRVSEAEAQSGDLIYYVNGGMGRAHIAVYIGNGMAVHGGWNGNQTVTFKANVGSGPVYIRVH